MEFFDTHAHIHFKDYGLDADEVWQAAQAAGVTRMLAVGCDDESSQRAVDFARGHDGVWAVVGIHPHQAARQLEKSDPLGDMRRLLADRKENKIVAIGEFGLDYHYDHSPPAAQQELVELHLELAQEFDLPVVLHIREAFRDLWPIFDRYHSLKRLRGVVHCFTATELELTQALERGLYVALNGIVTFSKDEAGLAAAKVVPLDRLLLETDAPYLTPKPFRGKICTPEHVITTAQFLADMRSESLERIARQTTINAQELFEI